MNILIHELSALYFRPKAQTGPIVGAEITGHAVHVSDRQNYSTHRRNATFRVYPGVLQGIPHFGRWQPLCTASTNLFAFRSFAKMIDL